jgi:hypothetical protein
MVRIRVRRSQSTVAALLRKVSGRRITNIHRLHFPSSWIARIDVPFLGPTVETLKLPFYKGDHALLLTVRVKAVKVRRNKKNIASLELSEHGWTAYPQARIAKTSQRAYRSS